MTPKQERFVQEYLVDLNATQAAIRAGYSPNGAEVTGCKLLRVAKVREAVDAARDKLAAKAGVTAERIVEEYARLAFSDPRAVMKWGPDGVKLKPSDDLTDGEAALVAEVSQTETKDGGSMKVKLHDKKGALDSLARHLGMFIDRQRHEGEDGGPVSHVVRVVRE